ncbi:MAG: DUF445 family protein [Clostridiales Family XIII bacterium]|jgi:hypothetical protein|nr:DUF445 family protein [Clostridiales Family XIII bacterium]
MTILDYLSGPVIGAVIGYITNYVAIRMLFRPLEPVYIRGRRLPFTPGIVPRRKDALAVILGKAVVDRFFGSDDLEEIFTSGYLSRAFAEGIADALTSDSSIKELSLRGREQPEPQPRTKDEADNSAATSRGGESLGGESPGQTGVLYRLKEELCVHILAAALKVDAAQLIAGEVSEIIKKNTQGQLIKKLSDGLMKQIQIPLSEKIEGYILNDARPVVMALIDEEFEALTVEPVRDITGALFPDREELTVSIARIYTGFMQTHVRAIVSTIDVESQITDKIKEMDPIEVEALVLSVVKKELRYVVWLGALLGLIIGAINILI